MEGSEAVAMGQKDVDMGCSYINGSLFHLLTFYWTSVGLSI